MASRRKSRIMDLTNSDDDVSDDFIVATPARSALKRKIHVTELGSDLENHKPAKYPRSGAPTVSHQLSEKQYQQKLRGPIAWVARPNTLSHGSGGIGAKAGEVKGSTQKRHGHDIRRFFSKQHSDALSRPRNSTPVQESILYETPSSERNSARPQRRSAAKADALSRKINHNIESSSSEDELANTMTATRKPRAKPFKAAQKATIRNKKAGKDEDSDFDAGESTRSSEDTFHAEEEDSSSEASTAGSDVEEDLPTVKVKSGIKPAGKPASEKSKSKANGQQRMVKLITYAGKGQLRGLDLSLPPLSEPKDIFRDLTGKALTRGFDKALQHLCRPLRVATMCSGTESPLLALEMIQESLDHELGKLKINHLFSAEIVPYKQAYIERNFSPKIIFRDITELTQAVHDLEPRATTAYGGKVPIPQLVDLLIAGTSCVDFSKLNNRAKSIEEVGESGDTWRAVLAYCKAFRPTIVILENVRDAAWEKMLDDYTAIGYESAGVYVDTKQYYLPQTRQRGYMVCFDKSATAEMEADLGKQWTKLMEFFRRPASSPASSFLLTNDKITRMRIRNDDTQHEVDWAKCEIRHMQYRHEHRLGGARPVTQWSESGSIQVPETGHAEWYKAQTERVWDLLDIAVLRKALPKNNFYDPRYKTRIWDVSQNIDRDQDNIPFGISGCITPRGIFFLSDAGRAFAPEETLKMQGLPLNKISFTTEAPVEIQDLAGNAMSMPVIGAAILAALTTGYSLVRQDQDALALEDADVEPTLRFTSLCNLDELFPSAALHAEDLSLTSLLDKARLSLRRCFCEGANGLTTKSLQRCSDCGHTTCLSCGGNPAHNYRQDFEIGQQRVSPGSFENYVRQCMPLELYLDHKNLASFEPPKHYGETLNQTLTSGFRFQSVRRTHCWTIFYTSARARLELVFDGVRAQWRLYAIPLKSTPSNSPLRAQLSQPIARATLNTSLFERSWQLRQPLGRRFPLTITASKETVASWWSRMGLPDFSGHSVPSTLDIHVDDEANDMLSPKISGRYRHLPYCGTACDSLYQKIDNGHDDEPLYLFLDPTGTGDPDDDCFVFSYSKARLEYDEVRMVIAKIAAPWRPWSRPGKQNTEPVLLIEDLWSPVDTVGLQRTDAELQVSLPKDIAALTTSVTCTSPLQIISCFIPGFDPDHINGIGADSTVIIKDNNEAFYEDNAWLFEGMRRHMCYGEWSPLKLDHNQPCLDCAPAQPALRWSLQGRDVRAYEDSAGAAEFERAMKRRPDPIQVLAVFKDGAAKVSLNLNLATLAHRARSRLPPNSEDVQYEWRLLTNGREMPFVFMPFQLKSTAKTIQGSDQTGLTVSLFPQQQQSLTWMKKQELGIELELSSVEEAPISAIGWRAEVRARSRKQSRGGICADHPGFGKTILSLALISSEFIEETPERLLATLSERNSGKICTAATLIVCPGSLVSQWIEEIGEKLGSKSGVISIPTVATLNNVGVEDFRKAKIIIVNRAILASEAYTDRLAAFAAIPGPAVTSGRAFAQWRAHALEQITGHLEIMKRGQRALESHIKSKYQDNIDSEEFQAAVPSKRLRGQSYVNSKQKGTQASKAAPKTIEKSALATVGKPLLEMFHFNRIIVDEFHQYEPKEFAAIVSLEADKRWGLSGTPAMGDFYEIAKMGQLLGLKLPLGSMERGIMKMKNARDLRNEMSGFELFDTMRRQLPSQSTYAEIYALHQRFLDTFVRQNIGDFSKLPYQDHLVPVTLEFEQRLLYTELSQHLNTLQMRIKKSRKSRATDRTDRLDEAVKDSKTAEEALSKAASFCNQLVEGHSASATSLLSDLITSCRSGIDAQRCQIPKKISAARAVEPEKFQKWKESRLQAGGFEDQELVDEVTALIKDATKASKADVKGETDSTAQLQDACMRLLIERRSVRYLQKAMQLQQGAAAALCDNANCYSTSKDIAISALCGHALCRDCYTDLRKQAITRCAATGCSSAVHDHHLLWKSKMGNLEQRNPSPFGSKLERAAQLLLDIQEKQEQAILFVQFPKQVEQAALALQHYGISNIVVDSANTAGSQLAKFRETAGTKEQSTAIILNASDETAAGSNLQNANHVIFLAPLLRDTQYTYDATMAQAIGRVRRYGQTKEIHVYRLVALDTIDVDILEHRERRTNALVEQGATSIKPPSQGASECDPLKRERTQLVREHGKFSLRPQSWLIGSGMDEDGQEVEKVKGKKRVSGWEDFSSLVKFSDVYTEDDG